MAVSRRVLLVDDHPLVRHGIARLLGRTDDLQVCAEAGTVQDALSAIREHDPDVATVELNLGDDDGYDLLRHVQHEGGHPPILVVSEHDTSDHLQRALRLGARGFISKEESPAQIIDALRQIAGGGTYLGRKMTECLPDAVATAERPAAADDDPVTTRLSKREHEVLHLIGNGLRPRRIARDLNLSVHTVHSHRENLKKKLGFATTAELDRFAVEWVHDER